MSEPIRLRPTEKNTADLPAQPHRVAGDAAPGLTVEPVMSVEGAGYAYRRGHPVLQDISAALMPGRVTALIGPNASGKSTLVRLLLGALEPRRGSIAIGGMDVGRLRPADRARWISYVPQRAGVGFAFTVRQIVAMARHAAGDAARQADAIERLLVDYDLADVSERPFAHLSGGQQQRVLLARAHAQSLGGGRVMLLDEPASHLDLRHAHALMRRLRMLAGEGLAVLVVVHDLNLALQYADDAWLLDAGRLAAAGPWGQVLMPEVLQPVYGVDLRHIAPEPGDPEARPALLVGMAWGAATMLKRSADSPDEPAIESPRSQA